MTAQFKLSDDTTTIDLLATTASRIALTYDQMPGLGFDVETYFSNAGYSTGGGLSGFRYPLVERTYNLLVEGTDHDDIADSQRALWRLLEDAALYHIDPQRLTPTFLIQQADNETDPRYCLVYGMKGFKAGSVFDNDFRYRDRIDRLEVRIVQSPFWSTVKPGDLPPAPLALNTGPGNDAKNFVTNDYSNATMDYMYNYDASAAAFSGNLASDSGPFDLFTGWTAGSATGPDPAAGDIAYFGFVRPVHNVVIHIIQELIESGGHTLIWELSDGGGGWNAITPASLGESMYLHDSRASVSNDTFFDSTGYGLFTVIRGTNVGAWLSDTVNGSSAHWLRCRINSMGTVSQHPQIGLPSAFLSNPWMEVSASEFKGDTDAPLLMRIYWPTGGDETTTALNASKIIVGLRTSPSAGFLSHLNLGNVNHPGWSHTLGTDASQALNPAAPGASHCQVTFATDEAMVMRIRTVKTNGLAAYLGRYKALLRCLQSGGSAGDTTVKLRIGLDGVDDYSPKWDTDPVALRGVGLLEAVDLGVVNVPLVDPSDTDSTSLDLIFEIHAKCGAGLAGTVDLYLYDIVLIPIDEWSTEMVDPITNSQLGSSALRGPRVLEDDGGVLLERCFLRHNDGTNLIPLESWSNRGAPPRVKPGKTARFVFLCLHNAVGEAWGYKPLEASAAGFAIELYSSPQYAMLAGDD